MATNQELQQASVRAVTGTAYSYNDDWMALFDLQGIAEGAFNDRMLVFLNGYLGTSYKNINDAKKAFAVSKGFTSWNELGSFDIAALYFAFSEDLSVTDRIVPVSLTTARASTTYVYNSSGVLTSVASGAPAFTYDPSTLTSLGLRQELAETNVLLNSVTPSSWSGNGVTSFTADAATGIDGLTNAAKMVEDTANTYHCAIHSFTGTAAAWYGYHIVKADATYTKAQLFFSGASNTGAVFDLTDGSVLSTTGTLLGSGSKDLGNGWWMIWISMTLTAAVWGLYCGGVTSSGAVPRSHTGDGSSGIYFDRYPKIALGTVPTSPIPTGATSVTRAVDTNTLATSGWLNAAGGTFVFEGRVPTITAASSLFGLSDGTANERIYATINSSGNGNLLVVDGGVTQADVTTANAATASTSFKFAVRVEANSFAACLNGGTVATDVSGTLPTVTTLTLLQNYLNAAQSNGTCASFRYYPPGVTDAQLQVLTA